jgi:hypothetical protein
MRRFITILLLCLASVYLSATYVDPCGEGPVDDCAPICHILCADGCASVPVPEIPASPLPEPTPGISYKESVDQPILSLGLEPEKEPPRL